MHFANRLKGGITQTLLQTLLQDGGYRIVPLGIEEVIREVSVLPPDRYTKLSLPLVLRSMPDFFVAREDMQETWLVEVKYRMAWNNDTRKKLGAQILDQVRAWGPLSLIVFLGQRGKDTDTPSSWFGMVKVKCIDDVLMVFHPDDKPHAKWNELTWKHFYRIQDFFTTLRDKPQYEQQTLNQVSLVVSRLAELHVFYERA